jgi:putative membrane protein
MAISKKEKTQIKEIAVSATNLKEITKNEDQERILILNVDRDNDIGKLLKVSGPILGFENNLKLASDLLLLDPEESDANAIFGALKKYNDLKKDYNVQIATLTGHSKENLFFADKNIAIQLKQVFAEFPASGIVFVSDGAEDDQVIPIVQNFAPIISKETIIVRQEKNIENTFYFIKKAIKDPAFSRIIFGIPAIILLLFFFFGYFAFQILALVLGLYFLIKGFNLEPKIYRFFENLLNKLSLTRLSFPFYLAGLFLLFFTIFSGINLYLSNPEFVFWSRLIYVIRAVLLYLVLSFVAFVVGDLIDIFYVKEAYKLGKSIFLLISIFVFSAIFDLALQLIIGQLEFNVFIISVVVSTVFLFLLNRITSIFDITTDITDLLIGLPVVSRDGVWIGQVVSVDSEKNVISYATRNGKVIKVISKKHFVINNGRVII